MAHLAPGPEHRSVKPRPEALVPQLPRVPRHLHQARRRPRARRLGVPRLLPDTRAVRDNKIHTTAEQYNTEPNQDKR